MGKKTKKENTTILNDVTLTVHNPNVLNQLNSFECGLFVRRCIFGLITMPTKSIKFSYDHGLNQKIVLDLCFKFGISEIKEFRDQFVKFVDNLVRMHCKERKKQKKTKETMRSMLEFCHVMKCSIKRTHFKFKQKIFDSLILQNVCQETNDELLIFSYGFA